MTMRQALTLARTSVQLERHGPDYDLHYQQDGQPKRWPMAACGYRAANVARSIAVLQAATELLRRVEAGRLGLYWSTLPSRVTGLPDALDLTPVDKPARLKKDRSARRKHQRPK